jgi:hypothetical protein
MYIINSERNKSFIDLLFNNINKKSIADCIFLILNVNNISISLEIKDIKEILIEKMLNILSKSKIEIEFEYDIIKEKFKLEKIQKNEFDSNNFYFYDEKINVKFLIKFF